MPVEVKCQTCDTIFSVKPSEIKKGGGKYCSKKCYFETKQRPLKTCPICKTKFKGRPKQEYCSRKCRDEGHRERLRDPNHIKNKNSLNIIHGDEIVRLYTVEKVLTPKIAEIIGCSDEGVRQVLIKRKIKLLSKREASKEVWKDENKRIKISRAIKEAHLKNPNIARKISESTKGPRPQLKGKNNPNWKGGISFEPYCSKFNEEFKERVREFWGRKCGLCGKKEEENKGKLSVHHVNYNKMACCDNVPPLFIPLCKSSHPKTNFNREYWERVFTEYIMIWFDGESYIKN